VKRIEAVSLQSYKFSCILAVGWLFGARCKIKLEKILLLLTIFPLVLRFFLDSVSL
jgi:hypothetical protein